MARKTTTFYTAVKKTIITYPSNMQNHLASETKAKASFSQIADSYVE